MENIQMRILQTQQGKLEYQLTYGKLKNLRLYVREDCTVDVRAPSRTPITYIEDFLCDHMDWIQKQQLRMNNLIVLPVVKDLDAAQAVIMQSFARVWPLLSGHGIPFPQIAVRNMSSRWGSCTPNKKHICINAALVNAPEDLLDYVVLHELTHFVSIYHDNVFWEFIGCFMPDCKKRRKALRQFKIQKT